MKRILIFAAFILIISSCKKDITGESVPQAGLTAKQYAKITDDALLAKSKEGTWDKNSNNGNASNGDGYITKVLKSTGSGTITYTGNGCGEGTVRFNSTGTANSTILGPVLQETTFCYDMSTGAFLSAITGVGTTRSGDKVFYALVGAGIDLATGFTYQDYVFTGGTGKYTGATGTLHLLYHINTPSNYAYTGTGSINLPKNSRDED